MKVCVCTGTRPEVIKMAPLVKLMSNDSAFTLDYCATGQHKELLYPLYDFFSIYPDTDFGLMAEGQDLNTFASRCLEAYNSHFIKNRPDIVLAQGDTTSTACAALAAYYQKIPFGHVEAGLRTKDKYSPWPEEGNRALIAPLSDLLFAPTENNQNNLLAEGINQNKIFVTGNTVVDALFMTLELFKDEPSQNNETLFSELENRKIVLITVHRRENHGEKLSGILSAIYKLATDYPDYEFVIPVHPNPSVKLNVENYFEMNKAKNISLVSPLPYEDFVRMMSMSYLIISDSGGIQEEAPALGKPVILIRDSTERPEAVEAGVCKLVGNRHDDIYAAVKRLLDSPNSYQEMIKANSIYGEGDSALKIIKIIKNWHENFNDQ